MSKRFGAALAGCAVAILSVALLAGCAQTPPTPVAPAAVSAPPMQPAPTAPPPATPRPAAMAAPAAAAPPAATAMPAPTVAPMMAPTPSPRRAPAATATPAPEPTAAPTPEPTPMPAATPEPEGDQEEAQFQGPPPPTMTELADGVYQYFGYFSSTLVVISDDEVLITDPAIGFRGQSVKEEIAKLTDTPVTTIVLTHEHYDHIGGTDVFEDAKVICHRNCLPVFELFKQGEVPGYGPIPDVDETFDDFKEIRIGDKVVELHYLGPGDGDATTVIYMPEERIVVTADLYEPRALTHKMWVDDKNFAGVRHILNTISGWELEHVVNAHSPGTDPVDILENVEYFNDLYDAVRVAVDDAIAQAGGARFGAYGLFDTLPQTLTLDKYKDWGNYDTSFPKHVERMLLAIYHGD